MENQIVIQTLLESGSTKQVLALSHFNEPKIKQTGIDSLKMVLRKVIVLLGIKKEHFPDDSQKAVILEFIQNNYSNLTLIELYKAFELALTGKLNVSTTVYQNFNCEYISGILNAYTEYVQRNKIYTKYLDTPPVDPEKNAELIKEANNKFLQKRYEEFQELVESSCKQVMEDQLIYLQVAPSKVDSFISAITLFSELYISENQNDWIESIVNKSKVSKTLADFKNKEEFLTYKKSIKRNHTSLLMLEIFLCSAIKERTQRNPNEFFQFTIKYNEYLQKNK